MTGVSLAPKTSTAEAGVAGSRDLIATIEPDNAANKSVTFTTENVEGLSVSTNGKLEWTENTPAGIYETTVATEDGGFTETHRLTLEEQEEPEDPDPQTGDEDQPESIEISPTAHTFIDIWEPGTSKRFNVTILPEDADQGYTVESSDESVMRARIDGDVYGAHDLMAIAMSPGTATLTVKTLNGLTATAEVTVPEQN